MIIAGVDPGIQNTGVAGLQVHKSSIELIKYEQIKTNAADSFEKRLKCIYDSLYQFIEKFSPEVLALEQIFYSRNVKVALKMGHARGISLLAAANRSIPVAEYSPREVKLAVTGNGNASKQQVQKMICHILNLTSIPSQYDVTDAMAIAYCHSQRMRFK
ncbi:crossover junction endodeoxyribonuclease RuvC [candidate division KSB1 bacterium 4572_119]|nr:MAG: crossover junction endodeoxyribonuclease RuvC [candidate division KSB1 bacterium 4572_119]